MNWFIENAAVVYRPMPERPGVEVGLIRWAENQYIFMPWSFELTTDDLIEIAAVIAEHSETHGQS